MKQMRQTHIDTAKIRLTRKSVGLSQVEAAKRLNISKQRLNAYEQGHDRLSADMLIALCGIYDVSIDAFKKDEISLAEK